MLGARGRRYRRLAWWFAGDSVWRYRRQVAAQLVLSGVALALQAAALGVLLAYARVLEHGDLISVGGYRLAPQTSISLLVAAIGIGAALFIIASMLRLQAERGFQDLAGRYGVFCARRLLVLLAAALHGSGPGRRLPDQPAIRKLAGGGSQICSRAFHGLLGTLPSLFGLTVFTGFLLYLDAALSLLVMLVLALSFFAFYGFSVNAVALMRERVELKRQMGESQLALLACLGRSPSPPAPGHRLFEAPFRDGAIARHFHRFFRSQGLGARTTCFASVTQALVLATVGLVKGREIIASGSGFGDLAIFLIAGRMAVGAFFGIAGSLVMINRFVPTVAEYRAAIRDMAAPGKAARRGAGGSRRVPPALCWLVPDAPPAGMSFCEATGLTAAGAGNGLRLGLGTLGLTPTLLDALPHEPLAPMDAAAWRQLDSRVFHGAHILAACQSERPLVLIGAGPLAALSDAMAPGCLRRCLAGRILLIATHPKHPETIGRFGESHILMFDGTAIAGWTDPDSLRADPRLLRHARAAKREPGEDLPHDDA